MNLLILFFTMLMSVIVLMAACIASLRLKLLQPFWVLFPAAGIGRILLSLMLWLAGVAVVISIGVPFVAFFASCLVFISSVPMLWRVAKSGATGKWIWPLSMMLLSIIVALLQPLGLKVMALPKADELAYAPVPFQVIKTYEEGLWWEGISANEDGSLYLSGNRGIDFNRSDYYHDAQGILLARTPDGTEQIVFQTPKGNTAGVPLMVKNKGIYLTSHGTISAIWHIDVHGQSHQLAKFPANAWPNGLDMGPDGQLYAPDSQLGLIWRIDPVNGQVSIALRDAALAPRPFIALAPGANGLHFVGNTLLVTVSDQTSVLEYTMNASGSIGHKRILASGIPGDGFAIGVDGALFVTTHPYNTLVRITAAGKRSIIGNANQQIIGATDACFGKAANDNQVLYVVTDGGAFTGGPNTKGALIALRPYAKK